VSQCSEAPFGRLVIVEATATTSSLDRLQRLGVTIANVDFRSASRVALACSGAACVVSALAGLAVQVASKRADGWDISTAV
jgi:hypothetical protein